MVYICKYVFISTFSKYLPKFFFKKHFAAIVGVYTLQADALIAVSNAPQIPS